MPRKTAPHAIVQMNGAILRSIRKDSGLSQMALAEKVGLSKSTISRLESNQLGIGKPFAEAIAEVLGYPLDWFLMDDEQIDFNTEFINSLDKIHAQLELLSDEITTLRLKLPKEQYINYKIKKR